MKLYTFTLKRRILYLAHVYDAGEGFIGSQNMHNFVEISTPTCTMGPGGPKLWYEPFGVLTYDQEHKPERTTFGFLERIVIERVTPEHNKNEY